MPNLALLALVPGSWLALAPQEAPHLPPASSGAPLASVVSWIDHDGDGRLDALASTPTGRLQLLANRAGGFEDVTRAAGLEACDAVALVLVLDYDGDGLSDLFVGRSAGASLLLRNEGGSFLDMTAGAGLAIEEPVQAAHALDEDGDGRLDLHVATGSSNRIWRGLPGGFFEPVELPLGSVAPAPERRGGALAAPAAPEVASDAAAPTPRLSDEDPAGVDRPASPAGAARSPAGAPSAGTTPLVAFPGSGCALTLRDQAFPAAGCLEASSFATLGKLYPLSTRFFVQQSTGFVGINTTSPAYRLHVNGQVVSGTSTSATGNGSAVGGGSGNAAGGSFDVIAGGSSNATTSPSQYNSIGGGEQNTIEGLIALPAGHNTIGGGRLNSVTGALSHYNTIGGGRENRAGGAFIEGATVPGGVLNDALGTHSLAAGYRAKANHAGSFVWGDFQNVDKPSSTMNEFNVYADGGLRFFATGVASPSLVVGSAGSVGIGTATPAHRLHVEGKAISGIASSASGMGATVSGGELNSASGLNSVIGGGFLNSIAATGDAATIAGGDGNSATQPHATVAGGTNNDATGSGSAIGGGGGNVADGDGSTITGGGFNQTVGLFGTVCGGSDNLADRYSFAAGHRAKAQHVGAFVWGDSQFVDKPSSADDQFNVYSEGGMRVFAAGVASPSMVVDAAGSVGIGTATPLSPLHVEGGIRSAGASGGQVVCYNPNNQDAAAQLSWLNDVARLRISGTSVGSQNGLDIQTQGDVSLMRLLHNGNVGIGTTTPAFDLEVNGTAAKPGGGSWSVSSDARLKKDVADLEGALETLLALRGVTFEYIDPAAIGELEGRRTGFIAQEVEQVLPDWVGERDDGTKYLTIRGFEALAVEALRELVQRNQELAQRGDELAEASAAKDARIAELEARVARLEGVAAGVDALAARLAALER